MVGVYVLLVVLILLVCALMIMVSNVNDRVLKGQSITREVGDGVAKLISADGINMAWFNDNFNVVKCNLTNVLTSLSKIGALCETQFDNILEGNVSLSETNLVQTSKLVESHTVITQIHSIVSEVLKSMPRENSIIVDEEGKVIETLQFSQRAQKRQLKVVHPANTETGVEVEQQKEIPFDENN